jgi:hypothetical protein
MQKKKLKNNDLDKIEARYNSKLKEFSEKTIEEIKELYKNKMSSTDKAALADAWRYKVINNIEQSKNGITETTRSSETTEQVESTENIPVTEESI